MDSWGLKRAIEPIVYGGFPKLAKTPTPPLNRVCGWRDVYENLCDVGVVHEEEGQ